MPPGTNNCAITGASGFVGGELKDFLETHGWNVTPWIRRVEPDEPGVEFVLGQRVNPRLFQGMDALIHCAYDFSLLKWEEIANVNVAGTQRLLAAAVEAGVKSVVLISSLSAFPGCRSLYGKAKLLTEELGVAAGAHIIRPGLVYGDNPGGMFGRLVQQVRTSRCVPILPGGKQTQYLLHSQDLGQVVLACLEGRGPPKGQPIAAANEQGWEVRDILKEITQALGRRTIFVPIPWWLVWLGLRGLELARVRTNFRSDSLVSMVYQNPHPCFASVKEIGFRCRPFKLSTAMLA